MRWLQLLPLIVASFAPVALTDVKVPNLVKLDVEDAKENLEWIGLVIGVDPPGPAGTRAFDPSLDAGMTVEDQSPVAGQTLSPGSVVSVVLIVPPEPGTRTTYFAFGLIFLLLMAIFWLVRKCSGRAPAGAG